MTKILTVIGARPQFIKASVVSHAISEASDVSEVVVHTGQHYDANMSEVFFEELGMEPPKHYLGIGGGGHGEMTGRMLQAIEEVLLAERPDALLVYGDTNSTLAGALAAAKLHVPVAHVEAGLRSFNMRMPEEINRILTDRVSRWLFTPTRIAEEHLKNEGISPEYIIPVGDVMFDAAIHHGQRVGSEGRMMKELGLASGEYMLATVHRAENTDAPERFSAIIDAIIEISTRLPVVWPVHPRARGLLEKGGHLDRLGKQVQLIEPVGYLGMVELEKNAAIIATDSGGVQKEAFFHEVPCVTLRDETEWVELVDAGWNRLASPNDPAGIMSAIESSMGSRGESVQPYGSGDAAARIVQAIAGHF